MNVWLGMLMKKALCVQQHVYVGVDRVTGCACRWLASWPPWVFHVPFGRDGIHPFQSGPVFFMSACQQFPKPEMRIHSQRSARWCLSERTVVTCAGAHAPRGQAVRCGEAVEHADILRRQELNELGVIEHFPLAVQDGRSLVRDVNNLPRDERDGHSKYILQEKKINILKKKLRYKVTAVLLDTDWALFTVRGGSEGLTVFLRVYSEVMLLISSMV